MQDETRHEAKDSLHDLKDVGVRRVAMVSGDRQPVAARVAKEIGLEEVVAECLPQNKVEYVKAIRAKGYRVAVVGDGVNDAPALAAGDLGIAMGAAGSEVAIHSATIALMNNDLRRLPFLVRLSRMTRSVINQNFLFGVVFVIGGLVLAALKYINPVVAALMHVAVSLIVVFNSARLVRQGEELEPFQAAAPANPPTSGGVSKHEAGAVEAEDGVSLRTGVTIKAMTALEATATVEQLETEAQSLSAKVERLRQEIAAMKQQLTAQPPAKDSIRVAGHAEFRAALEKIVSENRELLTRLSK